MRRRPTLTACAAGLFGRRDRRFLGVGLRHAHRVGGCDDDHATAVILRRRANVGGARIAHRHRMIAARIDSPFVAWCARFDEGRSSDGHRQLVEPEVVSASRWVGSSRGEVGGVEQPRRLTILADELARKVDEVRLRPEAGPRGDESPRTSHLIGLQEQSVERTGVVVRLVRPTDPHQVGLGRRVVGDGDASQPALPKKNGLRIGDIVRPRGTCKELERRAIIHILRRGHDPSQEYRVSTDPVGKTVCADRTARNEVRVPVGRVFHVLAEVHHVDRTKLHLPTVLA